jgi:hypothetical protein
MQTPCLARIVEGDDVDAQLSRNLSQAVHVWHAHPPSDSRFDNIAVATRWSCPQSPGFSAQRGVITFLKPEMHDRIINYLEVQTDQAMQR